MGATGYVSRVVSRLSALHGGLELVYNEAVRQKKGFDEHQDNKNSFHPVVVSAIFGHEFLLGRFNFSQTIGIYFNRPEPTDDPIYLRVGLTYLVTKRIFLGINLKAHTNVADYMDFRIGYSF